MKWQLIIFFSFGLSISSQYSKRLHKICNLNVFCSLIHPILQIKRVIKCIDTIRLLEVVVGH